MTEQYSLFYEYGICIICSKKLIGEGVPLTKITTYPPGEFFATNNSPYKEYRIIGYYHPECRGALLRNPGRRLRNSFTKLGPFWIPAQSFIPN